jgi:Putative polyhydroxyalkanoic acid system protein (PHA_gran_rgn)
MKKTTRAAESSIAEPGRMDDRCFAAEHKGLHGLKLIKDLAMPTPLVVSIPHRLGREEARRRLQAGLTRAAASVPVLKVDEERWDGDRMTFRVRALGQAAAGHVEVEDDHVRVEVTLPWLLQRFAQAAQSAIKSRGNLLLTKRD